MLTSFRIYFKFLAHALRSKYWYLLLIAFVWLYRVDFMQDAGFGMAKVIQILAILIMGVWVFRQDEHPIQKTLEQSNASIKWLLWLYLFAVLSTVWAYNKQFAAFLSVQNVVFILFLFIICSRAKDFYILERFFIYGLISAFLFEAIVSRMEGAVLFNHFLPAGSTSAICLSYCATEYFSGTFYTINEYRRKQLLKFGIGTSIIVLVLSTSTGANASAIAGIAVGLLFSRHRIYGLLTLIAAIFLYMNRDQMDQLILLIAPGKTIEEVESGTGRERIWELLIEYANQKPLTGWGFACIERVTSGEVFDNQSLSDAHNLYIGIYGGLGIVGCVLLGLHIINQLVYTFRRVNMTGFLGLFAATCCALVNGYSYGYLSGKACSITLAYFILVILTYYYARLRPKA